jgi:prolyl-tRNA synthetase
MHIPTLREDPADADAASHRLLVRGGYIRPLMAGHYSLLPLAVRVRSKVISIIREEMNRIGGQEFVLPAMHPAEVWQRSGRWDALGELMFRVKDRKGADAALGVTHEEVFSTLSLELNSYRQLPQIWYQFQTKFRDEVRPKAGLMRTREFTMKDAYSFDLAPDGLDTSFDAHHEAYRRIFARLGIPAIPVEASSGAMGGSASTEFMCPSEAGEDDVVHCPSCRYAANREKATSQLATVEDDPGPARPVRIDTPDARTIDDLVQRFDAPAERQIKTLVYVVDSQLILALLRGDHGLVEQKLIDATAAVDARPAHPDEIRETLGASPGSLGAVGVSNLRIIADEALRGRRNMFTGANADDVHLAGVDIDRDITVSQWVDLRSAEAGEPCPQCGQPLQVQRAMEVGHIFKLGYKYSDAFDATVLDAEGQRTKIIMGSYGIGVERAMSAIIECHHDEKGIVWPIAVAPFHLAIVVAQPDDPQTVKTATEILDQLGEAGVEVIVDDRPERIGVKFSDVELVGIPLRLVVSKRGLSEGTVELTERATGNTHQVPANEIVPAVQKAMASLTA